MRLVHWPLMGARAVTSGTARRGLAGVAAQVAARCIPNVTAHPSSANVQSTVLLYNSSLLCGFNVPIKGLKRCANLKHGEMRLNYGLQDTGCATSTVPWTRSATLCATPTSVERTGASWRVAGSSLGVNLLLPQPVASRPSPASTLVDPLWRVSEFPSQSTLVQYYLYEKFWDIIIGWLFIVNFHHHLPCRTAFIGIHSRYRYCTEILEELRNRFKL